MYGAILGDIIGSPYEFDRGGKTKDFPLFSEDTESADDCRRVLERFDNEVNDVF